MANKNNAQNPIQPGMKNTSSYVKGLSIRDSLMLISLNLILLCLNLRHPKD